MGELGRGAAGLVVRCEESATGRQVAVKLLDDPLGEQEERFQREGEVAASLQHPGIVRLYSAGVAERPYLVYELVEEAETLDQVAPRLSRERRLDLVLQVAEALAHAHARGVVHRDVKPANVLVDREGRARVTDFGLATATWLRTMTATDALLGTPYYMAPELLGLSEERASPASDVWALGVVLYEALVGERPFKAATVWELAAQVARGPEPPRKRDKSVPAALERVCLRALAQQPGDRYEDAGAFARDLRVGLSEAEPERYALPFRILLGMLLPVYLVMGLSFLARHAVEEQSAARGALSGSPTPEASAAPRGVAARALDLRLGARWRSRMRWTQRKRVADGDQRVVRRVLVAFELANEVVAVEGADGAAVATIRAELRSLEVDLRGDLLPFHYDSRESQADEESLVGIVPLQRGFDVKVALADGQVVAVEGLRALWQVKQPPDHERRDLGFSIDNLLYRFRDERFRQLLDSVLRVPPAAAQRAVRLTLRESLHPEIEIEAVVRRSFRGQTMLEELDSWRMISPGRPPVRYRRQGRFRFQQARLIEGQLQQSVLIRERDNERWIFEWSLRVERLPADESGKH